MYKRQEIDKAYKIIDYAIKVEAMDKSTILALKAIVMEIQGRHDDAIGILNSAKLLCINADTMQWLDTITNRIKTKRKLSKKIAKRFRKKSVTK